MGLYSNGSKYIRKIATWMIATRIIATWKIATQIIATRKTSA